MAGLDARAIPLAITPFGVAGGVATRQSVRVDDRPDPVREHEQSSDHRAAVLAASAVGCFYCRKIYSPTEIEDWIDEDESGVGQTAMCGRCGVDAVIPVRDGIDVEFLARMRRHWFSRR